MAEHYREEYNVGFEAARKAIKESPSKDMYANRDKAFSQAHDDYGYAGYVSFKEGYEARIVKEIEAMGARQAAYDRGKGHSQGLLEGHRKNLIDKGAMEAEHIKAFEAGYRRELVLDRQPLVTTQTIKARLEASRQKMQQSHAAQQPRQAAAYQEGMEEATHTIRFGGLQAAQDLVRALPQRLGGVMRPLELKAYMQGYTDRIKAVVASIAKATTINDPKPGARFEVKAPAKQKEHCLGM